MLVGAALLVNGVRGWMTRQASDDLPWWDQYIQDVTPAKALRLTHARALRLALLLSVANPKILLLATAAGLTNSAAGLTPAVTVATTVAFTLLASSSVAAPVLLSISSERGSSASGSTIARTTATLVARSPESGVACPRSVIDVGTTPSSSASSAAAVRAGSGPWAKPRGKAHWKSLRGYRCGLAPSRILRHRVSRVSQPHPRKGQAVDMRMSQKPKTGSSRYRGLVQSSVAPGRAPGQSVPVELGWEARSHHQQLKRLTDWNRRFQEVQRPTRSCSIFHCESSNLSR